MIQNSKSKTVWMGCLLLISCLAARPGMFAAAPERDSKPASEPIAVEFELLKSLHIAVQVKLNDAGPFRMIFDLGSPVMLVSGKAAAGAGLISPEAAKRPAFFGMRGESKVKKVELGDVTAKDVPVIIMDHPTLKAAAEFLGPLDGIVGYPFFARYKFTIDYPASTIMFTPSEYKPQDVMQLMMNRMFSGGTAKKRVVAPAALWGIELDKPEGDHEAGMIVSRVWPTGPADAAGLEPGDRLLTIDGRWVDSLADVIEAVSFAKPGEPAQVALERGGQPMQLVVHPRLGL